MRPHARTSKLFSSRMMSANSLAMSTAVSTEIPTSAAFSGAVIDAIAEVTNDVALFVAAPITRAFCAGDNLQNVVDSAASAGLVGHSFSTSLPSRTHPAFSPTSLQILRVMISLSPVRILTTTSGRAGRRWRLALYPWVDQGRHHIRASTRSFSSSTCTPVFGGWQLLYATATTRKPSWFSCSLVSLVADFGREGPSPRSAPVSWHAAQWQHLLDRAFADHKMLSPSAHDHRHAPSLEVEGNFVDFFVVLRAVDDVLQSRRGRGPPCPAGSSSRSDNDC